MYDVYLPGGLWQVTAEIWLPGHEPKVFQRRYATERRAVDQLKHIESWPYPRRVLGVHYTDCDWRDVRQSTRALSAHDREEQR